MLAGRRGFYVVFPATPGARSWTWYGADRARGQGDAVGIMAMVAKMKSMHDIRSDMVFVTGLSAGGFLTVVLLADYPEVFAAGAAVAGGAYGCDMGCMGTGSGGNNAAAVKAAYPTWWNDPSTRKPRLMIVQGDKDNIVSYGNTAQTMQQWTSALGIPATPANARVGIDTTLKGYPYSVYSKDGHSVDVATLTITGMGHGTPIEPGTGTDQGGHEGAYAFAVNLYSPYYAAKFFDLL
jgi:poly(hydroxyalkanoate) depolymerase family esterase